MRGLNYCFQGNALIQLSFTRKSRFQRVRETRFCGGAVSLLLNDSCQSSKRVEAEFAELVECFVAGADGRVHGPEGELGIREECIVPALLPRVAEELPHPNFVRMGYPSGE